MRPTRSTWFLPCSSLIRLWSPSIVILFTKKNFPVCNSRRPRLLWPGLSEFAFYNPRNQRREKMAKAKKVLHHDDPPCTDRLTPCGYCRKCKLTPDMQSTCIYLYCPTCDVPLKNMRCPKCG